MAVISAFDVLGPNMIGPSSSTTRRSGGHSPPGPENDSRTDYRGRVYLVRFLFQDLPRTRHGQGAAGESCGFKTDDRRIRDSFSIAQQRGLRIPS